MEIKAEDISIIEIRNWQDTRPFNLLKTILQEREKEIGAQRLSRAHVEKPEGQLKLNYFLGYEDAIKDVLDILEFEYIEENDDDKRDS